MGFQGIIFDFNGVLLWDGPLQEQSWGQFSAKIRGWPFTAKELDVEVHGRTSQHTLQYLVGRPVVGEELNRLTEEKEAIYRWLCLDQGEEFKLSPGAFGLLGFLAAHQIPRTIATASGKKNLDFFVSHLGLDRWFEVGLIVHDNGTRPGKPAPDIYLQAARNLGLAPSECVVVEDSQSGLQAAYAAGIGHIVALGPVERQEELARLAGVSRVIGSLEELPRGRLFV